MKAFLIVFVTTLAACALGGCNGSAASAAAGTGSGSGATATVQGLSTPKSISVVTAK